ncbi:N-acetylneuraminate synthase family protein, partial [Lamprobacter modestohalophilus]|uniref:N-acetylneuraminate synthase family protein n=1 Tax=Lamprobacter modestohalophilus TaxID=1064514 RepID=UPI002ADEAA1C
MMPRAPITAKQLIDAAATAGADLVKFQTFSAERLATRSAPKTDYQTRTTDQAQSQFAMLRQLELSAEMHDTLIAHCQARGIGFFSTGFDIPSLDDLASLSAETSTAWIPRLLPAGMRYQGQAHEQPVSEWPRVRLPVLIHHSGYRR